MIRQALTDLRVASVLTTHDVIADALAYFDRRTDVATVRAAIKTRFGMGVKVNQDPNDAKSTYETYAREGFNTQVDSGQIENISLGLGIKIVNALASMFTEVGLKFSLMHPTVEDTKNAQALLDEHRDLGGFLDQLDYADRMSVQIGSAFVYVSYVGGALQYQAISPGMVFVYHSSSVIDNGVQRSADTTSLEDAFCVVIQQAQVDLGLYNYTAIFAASETYPRGRLVTYTASSISAQMPGVGSRDATDYEINGEICNPLTHYNQINDINGPEYPLIVLKGGTVESGGGVAPLSFSLYESAVEFDVAASHLLASSQRAASGTKVLSRNEVAQGRPLPTCVEGLINLGPGEGLSVINADISAVTGALDACEKLMIHMAAGYGVPDYMVISQDHTLDASSGVALQVKTRGLTKDRMRRVRKNQNAVHKLFKIETALIDLYDDTRDRSTIAVLVACDQTWDAGELRLPENRNDVATRIKMLTDLGVMDVIGAMREYYQFASDADAMDFYDVMKARSDQYKPLNQKPKMLGYKQRNDGQTNN